MLKLLVTSVVTLGLGAASELEIRFHNIAPVPAPELRSAVLVLQGIFRQAGIALTWVDEDALAPDAIPIRSRCLQRRKLGVRLIQGDPKGAPRTVLGSAAPFVDSDINVTIFHQRVVNTSVVREVAPGTILGYAIAHEIAHVLLRSKTHGPWGLMGAEWRDREFSMMRAYVLRFDNRDAERMRANLDNRGCQAVLTKAT